MKNLMLAMGAALVLVTIGLTGLLIDAPALVLVTVCLWTPTAMFIGWQIRAARVSVRSPLVSARPDESFA